MTGSRTKNEVDIMNVYTTDALFGEVLRKITMPVPDECDIYEMSVYMMGLVVFDEVDKLQHLIDVSKKRFTTEKLHNLVDFIKDCEMCGNSKHIECASLLMNFINEYRRDTDENISL